jgi:hypothetical protein
MKLLDVENTGTRIHRTWLHTGDDGRDKLTVETQEDGTAAIQRAKDNAFSRGGFRLKASIPVTMMEDAAKISAAQWGISVKDAFSELIQTKSDRAKKVMRMLTEGRDYRKLQTKHYRFR